MMQIVNWLGILLPILSTLAVVFFLFGLVKFMAQAGDEKSHEDGKALMVWGMIALFVMVGLWSIIGYMQTSIGLPAGGTTGGAPNTPTGAIPTPGS